mgnify:CR=1 FL=1
MSSAAKIYPPELFVQALKLIAEKSDVTFVYFGGKELTEWGKFFQQNLGNRLIDLSGKTTLRETCAVVSKTSMYIGTDTGTMHIAAALKLPVIMISKDAEDSITNYFTLYPRFLPWQTPTKIVSAQHALKPCNENNIGCVVAHPHCITQITPQSIADAFDIMKKIVYKSN